MQKNYTQRVGGYKPQFVGQEILHVAVSSTSGLKLSAVKDVCEGLQLNIEAHGYDVSSGVPESPVDGQTLAGAMNRANQVQYVNVLDSGRNYKLEDTVFVGLESGLALVNGYYYEETWAVVIFRGNTYDGKSSAIRLPDVVQKQMRWKTHADIMNELSKNYEKKDTIEQYTGGLLSRKVLLEEAFRNAMLSAMAPSHSMYAHA